MPQPHRRSTLRRTTGGLELVIPARRNVLSFFVMAFLIAFDYGAKTVRFAASVDEAEASQIISDFEALHNFQ